MKTSAFPAPLLTLALCVAVPLTATHARAQAVGVTMRLDTNILVIGQTTTLRVYAQVLPAYRANADRIFSWYIDLLNSNAPATSVNYNALQKPASDNDPGTSSSGFNDGSNRRGIYDTFLNLPAAGITNPVELLSVSVTGLASGRTRFSIQHGTGVPALSEDFIVAPQAGGEPLIGSDYGAALADLRVIKTNITKRMSITRTPLANGRNKVTISYEMPSDLDSHIEFRDLLTGLNWQTAPGAPHNSGTFTETNDVPVRFYRLRATVSP